MDRAKSIKGGVLRAPQFKQSAGATEEERVVSIMEVNQYDLGTMKQAIAKRIRGGGENREKS